MSNQTSTQPLLLGWLHDMHALGAAYEWISTTIGVAIPHGIELTLASILLIIVATLVWRTAIWLSVFVLKLHRKFRRIGKKFACWARKIRDAIMAVYKWLRKLW